VPAESLFPDGTLHPVRARRWVETRRLVGARRLHAHTTHERASEFTMDYPRYSYPPRLAPGLIANVLFGGLRSFRRDGQACVAQINPPLQVLGKENLPRAGPYLVTFNHYYRPGFNAWWMALALAATLPVDIHFVMTGELTYPGKWYAPLGQAGSRWLLRRFSEIYGFTSMPPMPPRPQDIKARTRSVRRTLAFARAHPHAVLGLAPEGGDQPGGLLNWPPAGAGRFILLLAEKGFPILPVGCYEDAGVFFLCFGAPYRLQLPHSHTPVEKDRHTAQTVMSAIAAQLPLRFRGEFA
jgi:1-acyl-sn-glycerol-3-phosphate acyltransferase